MKLFEYAVILEEKRDRDEELLEPAKLVVEPTHILCESQAQAELIAGRAIPEANIADLDRLTVVVRPF